MGGGRAKKDIRRQAASQERLAQTQADIGQQQLEQGERFLDIGEGEAAREEELYNLIRPYAEGLMGLFDPERYADLERPDVSQMIRRQYSDELADIEQSKHRALSEADAFYTGSGLSRAGIRGTGLATIARGALEDRGGARRRMQDRLTQEELSQYYDDLGRRGQDVDIGLQGLNALRGQQATFNPYGRGYGAGLGQLGAGAGTTGAAAGTHGQAAGTYYTSSRIPGVWSKIGGIAGRALSMASPYTAAGTGLRSIAGAVKPKPAVGNV